MKRPICLLLTALLLPLASCGGEPVESREGSAASRLVPFHGPEDLETYIEETAIHQLRQQYVPYCDGEGYGWGGYVTEDAAGGAAPPAQENNKSPEASPSHSETNTQIAGVDEADFIKTDGRRTFFLSGGALRVFKTWPANESALLASMPIDGWPTEMFLHNGKLVVFSSVYSWAPAEAGERAADSAVLPYGTSALRVGVYDVTTDEPRLIDTWFLNGWYTTSRRVGDSVRIVASSSIRWPELDYDYGYPPDGDPRNLSWQARCRAALARNEDRIRAQSLEEWLPADYRLANNGALVSVPADPTHFYRPTTGAQLGLAVVATLDLAGGSMAKTALLAQTGETFASHESLYIATMDWSWAWRSEADYKETTSLHKFSLISPSQVTYRASGSVAGHVLDQFSMDEWNGDLRIATTSRTWVPGTGTAVTDNRVRVLAEEDGALVLVGESEAIGLPGEQIYSSRFSGPRGFVVTYRQVDPLFTFDLSDRTSPRVTGALKIPGFSTYIHLLDETRLLTIGQDFDESGTVRNGVALQLFDVEDMEDPSLLAKQLIGTPSGYSEALWDHKAFNYFAETGILGIPFTDWSPPIDPYSGYWTSFTSSVKLFRIGDDGSITPRGEVSHADLFRQNDKSDWVYWYAPYVRRSVQIEDFVCSFSDAGMKVNRLDDALTPVATISLPVEPVSYVGYTVR